jgi:hypothetical protein
MHRLLVVLILAFSACTFQSDPDAEVRVTSIQVKDRDHKLIGTLASSEQMEAFNKFWRYRKILEWRADQKQSSEFLYYLDVRNENEDGGRWLYHPEGIVMRLSHTSKPRYQISDVASFNFLLGIKK